MKKLLRPKGCKKTISGRHIPVCRNEKNYEFAGYCFACGLVDDTGLFDKYLFPGKAKAKKIDDTNL